MEKMKKQKIIQLLILSLLLVNCTVTIETNKIDNNEKFSVLIKNDSNFSNVSTIGKGASLLIKKERDKAKKKKIENTKSQIEKIDGIQLFKNNSDTIKAIIQNDVLFDFNKFEIKDSTRKTITEFGNTLLQNIDSLNLSIRIVGHTDDVGSIEHNQKLSKKRAEAVSNILVQCGISKDKIITIGKGKDEPIANNNTSTGRAKNRRVEIIIDNPIY